MTALPVIDMSPLHALDDVRGHQRVANEIRTACRETGFFYVIGHRVDAKIIADLDLACRKFFALPEADKMHISMHHGGIAWRGYFPVGDTRCLAALMRRTEEDVAFYSTLMHRCRVLQHLFLPSREKSAWGSLLDNLDANGA